MKAAITLCVLLFAVILSSFIWKKTPNFADKTLAEYLHSDLGLPAASHYDPAPDAEQVEIGRQLVFRGKTNDSRAISKFFVCTDCHNQVQEDPNPGNPTPESRLSYAIENDLAFLQSTTFWGMSDRTSWYNDDYEKKYGELVKDARYNLRGAIQLCAQECAQGRVLKQWEEDAILAYVNSLQLKLSDLNLTATDLTNLEELGKRKNVENAKTILEDKYMLKSGAHKLEWWKEEDAQMAALNTENGKNIYDKSCLWCHSKQGPSQVSFDSKKLTAKKIENSAQTDTYWNLYKIIREGTYAAVGHKQYMPHFTAERMSAQQLADLNGYIQLLAEE